MDTINKSVPVYWLSPERFMIFNEGRSEPIEISMACDPASWEGDYGCKTKYKRLPDGSIEIISMEYTKPKKKGKQNVTPR